MNQRDALGFAAGELAEFAGELADDYESRDAVIPEDWSNEDLARVVKSFRMLSDRMNRLACGPS